MLSLEKEGVSCSNLQEDIVCEWVVAYACCRTRCQFAKFLCVAQVSSLEMKGEPSLQPLASHNRSVPKYTKCASTPPARKPRGQTVPKIRLSCAQLSYNQNPVLKWSTQNHASRIKKAAATISGWDCPLLAFIYPGFDCGSTGLESFETPTRCFLLGIVAVRILAAILSSCFPRTNFSLWTFCAHCRQMQMVHHSIFLSAKKTLTQNFRNNQQLSQPPIKKLSRRATLRPQGLSLHI